jgi:hypothetical protein
MRTILELVGWLQPLVEAEASGWAWENIAERQLCRSSVMNANAEF